MSGFDFERAKAFIAAIPRGRWSSYKDAAGAAGNPDAYMSAGNLLRASGGTIPNYWRVLHSDGSIADGFISHAPGRPNDPVSARELLESEGIRFDQKGRAREAQRFRYEDWNQNSDAGVASRESTLSAAAEAAAAERDKRIVADVSARRVAKGKPPLTPQQEEVMLERLAADRAAGAA
jgi:alkylated DNA nucleotide flippase Atl1